MIIGCYFYTQRHFDRLIYVIDSLRKYITNSTSITDEYNNKFNAMILKLVNTYLEKEDFWLDSPQTAIFCFKLVTKMGNCKNKDPTKAVSDSNQNDDDYETMKMNLTPKIFTKMMQHNGYDIMNKITCEIKKFERNVDDHHEKLTLHRAKEIGKFLLFRVFRHLLVGLET